MVSLPPIDARQEVFLGGLTVALTSLQSTLARSKEEDWPCFFEVDLGPVDGFEAFGIELLE